MTRPLLYRIIRKDPKLNHIYELTAAEYARYFTISPQRAKVLYQDLHDTQLVQSIEQDLKKYKVLTIMDDVYPAILKTIKDPPFVLYLLGNLKLLEKNPTISIVGTRRPTSEAKRKIDRIVGPLARNGWVIVSGMALGIDGFAHRVAIENEGDTIAVVGGGFNHIYPPQHRDLFHQLAEKHLIITEYSPDVQPRRYYFPERNRIISGLSFGTLVIEAKERSGSLITVDQALDQGREVYAVPGSPLMEQTSGCHKMIQDGAKLVQNAYDLLEEWESNEGKWCRLLSDLKE